MSDYLTAYGDRLKRNQAALLQLIKDVLAKDNTIEAYTHNDFLRGERHLEGVVFIKDDSINSIHFHEVPYRWSGCGYGEFERAHSGGENNSMPFEAQDVIHTFKPIQKNSYMKDSSKESYLKWHSYLGKYNPEDSVTT